MDEAARRRAGPVSSTPSITVAAAADMEAGEILFLKEKVSQLHDFWLQLLLPTNLCSDMPYGLKRTRYQSKSFRWSLLFEAHACSTKAVTKSDSSDHDYEIKSIYFQSRETQCGETQLMNDLF